ncbi:WPP domain-associated protein-like [Pyrus ussuriensis x Pyrus communis]|uniref:WPP domain-associated protein-like n=1 Tax=Pyrus ussuriensis x Pyrus communis TaxID=2448454 RepID=A0A5N5HZY0_9ROSA|nr:WPP domain-associated protein-like [Pyrus ussuriensis x Pyrus communis]
MTAFNTIVQEVKGILNSKQIDLPKKTPFWPLIKPFYKGCMSKDDIVKSDLDLNEMVKVTIKPSHSTLGNKVSNNIQISDEGFGATK